MKILGYILFLLGLISFLLHQMINEIVVDCVNILLVFLAVLLIYISGYIAGVHGD